jgi:hypothetical protein
MDKDTLIVTISDMHSGSSVALFPNHFIQFKDNNHTPTSKQLAMYEHWVRCAEAVGKARKDKRLVIVHNGDAIEGDHHDSPQNISRDPRDHVAVHIELMNGFKKMVDYRRGDKLYYMSGTETHTGDFEDDCAAQLGAEQTPEGLYVYDILELSINGRLLWWVHHGPTAGKGANKGNSLRNFLRNIFFDCVTENTNPPDVVITGHTHRPFYVPYSQEYGNTWWVMHGIINPSWQMKTRYAYKIAPVEKNKIGLSYFQITKDGLISIPPEIPVMKSR